ncbi:hypothetical protein SUDANB6_05407 [Streptomyces sp. enrichment culture]
MIRGAGTGHLPGREPAAGGNPAIGRAGGAAFAHRSPRGAARNRRTPAVTG